MSHKPKSRSLTPREKDTVYEMMRAYSPIPRAELDELAEKARTRYYRKGDFFTRIGENARMAGFVLQGVFRVYYVSSSGNMIIRNFCMERMPIGSYSAMLEGAPAQVNIEALEDSIVVTLPYDELIRFYERHRSWETYGRRLAEQQFVYRERREYQLLALSARERYEIFLKLFPGLDQRITQANIASYLGITAVSLSRLLHAPKKAPKN